MTSLETFRNENFVTFCTTELENYVRSFRGIETAIIATPDGFEIAVFSIENGEENADKLAAVASSLFALGSSLVGEFNIHACKSVILDSDRGKVFISTVSNMQHSLILMVHTNENAMLGNVMHGSKKLAERVSGQLNRL